MSFTLLHSAYPEIDLIIEQLPGLAFEFIEDIFDYTRVAISICLNVFTAACIDALTNIVTEICDIFLDFQEILTEPVYSYF